MQTDETIDETIHISDCEESNETDGCRPNITRVEKITFINENDDASKNLAGAAPQVPQLKIAPLKTTAPTLIQRLINPFLSTQTNSAPPSMVKYTMQDEQVQIISPTAQSQEHIEQTIGEQPLNASSAILTKETINRNSETEIEMESEEQTIQTVSQTTPNASLSQQKSTLSKRSVKKIKDARLKGLQNKPHKGAISKIINTKKLSNEDALKFIQSMDALITKMHKEKFLAVKGDKISMPTDSVNAAYAIGVIIKEQIYKSENYISEYVDEFQPPPEMAVGFYKSEVKNYVEFSTIWAGVINSLPKNFQNIFAIYKNVYAMRELVVSLSQCFIYDDNSKSIFESYRKIVVSKIIEDNLNADQEPKGKEVKEQIKILLNSIPVDNKYDAFILLTNKLNVDNRLLALEQARLINNNLCEKFTLDALQTDINETIKELRNKEPVK